jgi:hypothetical protein
MADPQVAYSIMDAYLAAHTEIGRTFDEDFVLFVKWIALTILLGTRSLPRIFEVLRQLFRRDRRNCMPMIITIFHMIKKPFEMIRESVQGHRWSAEDFDEDKMKPDGDNIFVNADLPWSSDQIAGTNLKLVKTTSNTDDSGYDVVLQFLRNYNEFSSTAADIRFGTECSLPQLPLPKNSAVDSGW